MLQSLHELETSSEQRDLTEDEISARNMVISDLEKNTYLDEICWRQKSRAMWLKEGDKNMKYFHKVTNSHRRHNIVRHLSINGDLSTDQDAIKNHISCFYKQLYTEDTSRRPLLDDLPFASIPFEEAIWLERPFEKEENFNVVSNMNCDKSPGPNGFPMSFYHACWSILQDDLLAVFAEFYEYGSLKEA